MSEHSWAKTLDTERQYLQTIDASFRRDFIVVEATSAHQRQKMDRFLIDKRNGLCVHRVDYKVDLFAGQTGNLALEDVSVRRSGGINVAGWLHTTIADWIVFFVPPHEIAYVMHTRGLRARWRDIQAGFPLRTTSTGESEKYETDFYAVPIAWLRQNRLIQEERRARL